MSVDTDRIEAAVLEILAAIGEDPAPRRAPEDARPGGPHVRGAVRRVRGEPGRPPRGHLRRRPRRDGHGPRHPLRLAVRAPHGPVHGPGPRRLHPGVGRADHRPVQAGPPGRRLRQAPPGPGADDLPDRRRHRGGPRSQGGPGGGRGRTPVHVHAGREEVGHLDGHLGRAGPLPQRHRPPASRPCSSSRVADGPSRAGRGAPSTLVYAGARCRMPPQRSAPWSWGSSTSPRTPSPTVAAGSRPERPSPGATR